MILAYLPLWNAGTAFEDWHWINGLGIVRLGLLGAVAQIVGFNLRAFHLASVAVHLVNTLLVGVCVAALHSRRAAVFAAVVFALLPQQGEVVSYLGVQPELTASCWILVACVLALTTNNKFWAPAIVGCVALALWTKAGALSGLLLVPVVHRVAGRSLVPIVPYGAYLLGALSVASLPMLSNPYTWQSEYGPLTYAGQQAVRLWRFAAFDLSLDPAPVAASVGFIALLALVAVLGVALVPRRGSWRLEAALALWIACALLPRFVLRIPELLHLHHLYLAMAGVSAYLGIRCTPMKVSYAR